MNIDTSWLEQTVFARKLSDEELAALSSIMHAGRAVQGEEIVSQGEPGGILYLLRSGTAVVRHEAPKPIDVATVGEGAVVGEMSFLTDASASASVVAKTDCEVYLITRSGFTELMNRHEDLAFGLFVYILRHTAGVIRHMNEEHISMMQYIVGSRMGA